MSDMAGQPAAEVTPGLSQMQRVIDTFTAPSKTFDDIKRGNRSWWMPFLIMVVISYIFFAAITTKIGWGQVAQNAIHMDPKAEERMSQQPPAQRDTTMKFTQYAMEGSFAASPLLILGVLALMSLVLLGTINFGFGGKAKFCIRICHVDVRGPSRDHQNNPGHDCDLCRNGARIFQPQQLCANQRGSIPCSKRTQCGYL